MKPGAYQISEEEFEEYSRENPESLLCVDYDRENGVFSEYGLEWDDLDESILGSEIVDSFIDGDEDVIYARDDVLDITYEISK